MHCCPHVAPFGSLLVIIFSLLGFPGAIFNIVGYFRWESYVFPFVREVLIEIPIVFFCFEALSA